MVKNELCANDQGMVYGYATNETKEYMPLPLLVAHKLMKQYEDYRRTTNFFYADAKCQASVEYTNDKPSKITTILFSASHNKTITYEDIITNIMTNVILPVIKEYKKLIKNTKYIINPSGRFTILGKFWR